MDLVGTPVVPGVTRITRITYDVASAAQATSVSIDVIRRAIRAGDLGTVSPRIGDRPVSKKLIPAGELIRWALDQATVRPDDPYRIKPRSRRSQAALDAAERRRRRR